jgi:hypothetical protein
VAIIFGFSSEILSSILLTPNTIPVTPFILSPFIALGNRKNFTKHFLLNSSLFELSLEIFMISSVNRFLGLGSDS